MNYSQRIFASGNYIFFSNISQSTWLSAAYFKLSVVCPWMFAVPALVTVLNFFIMNNLWRKKKWFKLVLGFMLYLSAEILPYSFETLILMLWVLVKLLSLSMLLVADSVLRYGSFWVVLLIAFWSLILMLECRIGNPGLCLRIVVLEVGLIIFYRKFIQWLINFTL